MATRESMKWKQVHSPTPRARGYGIGGIATDYERATIEDFVLIVFEDFVDHWQIRINYHGSLEDAHGSWNGTVVGWAESNEKAKGLAVRWATALEKEQKMAIAKKKIDAIMVSCVEEIS